MHQMPAQNKAQPHSGPSPPENSSKATAMSHYNLSLTCQTPRFQGGTKFQTTPHFIIIIFCWEIILRSFFFEL
jgi:hypothetical protein